MRYHLVLMCLCLFSDFLKEVIAIHESNSRYLRNSRAPRKLFGGYRITPRYCKPSKTPSVSLGGPTVCMFNHECSLRDGQVVGACMDGFLFGACCELPEGVTVGQLLLGAQEDELKLAGDGGNSVATGRPMPLKTTPYLDITSNGVSQIAASLLNPGLLPTAQDNAMVQISGDQYFSNAGVTHPVPETVLVNQQDNEIDPGYFRPTIEDRTTSAESSTPSLGISVSNGPIEYTTPTGFSKPIFRPKPPSEDKFVLVPTISHETSKTNKTQEYNSIVNIISMLNNTSTNRPFVSSDKTSTTEYDFSKVTSRNPPSTSYVFSTTIPPRRTTGTTTTKNTRPTKKKQTTKPTKKPTTYTYSLAPTKTTFANSPDAFITSVRPPSTSYPYRPEPPRKPVPSNQVTGPGFTVTSSPIYSSKYPTPAPTVIVLGPVTDNLLAFEESVPTTYEQQPISFARPTQLPQRKPISPVNHVTINNHVTQNIYSTSERPSPTILITPKPSISSSIRPQEQPDTVEIVSAAPSAEDVNFPPVRHPNLNLSIPSFNEDDITTPVFIEDEALNVNMESFVNKIIQDLQQPFNDLTDIVYKRNKTSSSVINLTTTTKKPVKKQGSTTAATTTRRPAGTTRPTKIQTTLLNTRPVTTTRPTTVRRTTTRRPSTAVPTRRTTVTTTRRVKTTKRPLVTTTPSFIEHSTEPITVDSDDYRTQCGIRPLMSRNSRIVGGKGATFGEFPWQVLVRESTWLGLFTKNKCGGVLISHRYVMTAAHCQPGFLASLVAVFGEFDISGDLESKKPISRNVKRVIVHRQYDAATFENDLALLELEQPVQFDSHIIPICLPRDGEDFTGRMATVTGWGRLKYGGGVPAVLQEVQVPIMENHVCQEMFRTAGHSKVILESFLCAGYANGQKDSCEGDSGGPLVLQRPDGRYQLAGTVSHGIKCAAPYLPGVYMRTQYFKPWITSITGVTAP